MNKISMNFHWQEAAEDISLEDRKGHFPEACEWLVYPQAHTTKQIILLQRACPVGSQQAACVPQLRHLYLPQAQE